jgi:hypothetical protein
MGELLFIDLSTGLLIKIIHWVAPNIYDYFNGIWFSLSPRSHKQTAITEITLWKKNYILFTKQLLTQA